MCSYVTIFIAEILDEEESRGVHDKQERRDASLKQGNSFTI